MKTLKTIIIVTLAAVGLAFLTGCETSSASSKTALVNQSSPLGNATVCPQCEVVLVQPDEMQLAIDGYEDPPYVKHSCSGCQGALTTLFTDGEYKHKCSICEDKPFSCDMEKMYSAN